MSTFEFNYQWNASRELETVEDVLNDCRQYLDEINNPELYEARREREIKKDKIAIDWLRIPWR